MKPRLLLIPIILATSAAIGDAQAYAKASAAALLSGTRTAGTANVDRAR